MITIFPNSLTPEDISWFKEDFEKLINTDPVDLVYPGEDKSVITRSHRLYAGDVGYDRLRTIINNNIGPYEMPYVVYQRQYNPMALHMDKVESATNVLKAKSIIIPLCENSNNKFQTLVFTQEFNDNIEFRQVGNDFINNKLIPTHKHSVEQNVDHCGPGPNALIDLFELDGIYNYELGSMGMFDSKKIHCSSNWKKFGEDEYKDIIVIRILVNQQD